MSVRKILQKKEGIERMVNGSDFEQYIVLSDVHAPSHDQRTYDSVIHFIRKQKPDHVVIIGDFIDMYAISRFDKNPERAHRLQEEVDSAYGLLKRLRSAAGKTPITYIEGNHEFRMQKYLWRHPEMHGLDVLEVPNLLRLKELKIDYVQEIVKNGNFIFTHGLRINKYASRSELDDHGISGMSGHTHRIQTSMRTDYAGTKVWHCIGHLSDPLKAEYVLKPDWQQGIGVVYFERNGNRFFSEVVPIVKNKFIYGGVLYTPNGPAKK